MSVDIEKKIVRLLEKNENVVLATIVSHSGSAPRTSGSKMLIRYDGSIFGTIGGGLLEAAAMEAATGLFESGGTRIISFDLSDRSSAKGIDMICGGNVQVRLELVETTASNLKLMRERTKQLEKEKKTLFMFGAGHVSQQLAILAKMVDFRVVVLDDRSQFANRDRFEDADEIMALSDFKYAFLNIKTGPGSYVVIVTRGHFYDEIVLKQALRTRAGYIGMIGSRKKRDAIYASLRKKGFAETDMNRVHSPVGIEIKAETPQEIAVSIVGEMIAHRAKNRIG